MGKRCKESQLISPDDIPQGSRKRRCFETEITVAECSGALMRDSSQIILPDWNTCRMLKQVLLENLSSTDGTGAGEMPNLMPTIS
jgi:hypothetical protein